MSRETCVHQHLLCRNIKDSILALRETNKPKVEIENPGEQKAFFKLRDGGTGDWCVQGKSLSQYYIIEGHDDSDGDNMHLSGFFVSVLLILDLVVCAWFILPATNGKLLI